MLNNRFVFRAESTIRREAEALGLAIEHIDNLVDEQANSIDRIRQDIADTENALWNYAEAVQKQKDDISRLEKELAENDLLFITEYNARMDYYKKLLESPMTLEAKQIAQLIRDRKYLGIVVYPHAVRWEPLQRPQHMLIEFARKGYLCFFCDVADSFTMTEIEERMFVVSNQDHLLQALQTSHVLVINSYLLQNPWIEHLPHKTIWYDVLDRVDFFSFYDRNMLAKHYQVLHEADIVTYSANRLKEYVCDRQDAIYMPNAARPEDFKHPMGLRPEMPSDLEPIVRKGNKIIGYYGAIEEWFDVELVKSMAEQPGLVIVLIGHCGIAKEGLPGNIHFLGVKPYRQLKGYAAFFDALMIPFKVTPLTDSVSPVKFFEYCAIGKPIITTPIAEVAPFAGPGITLVDSGGGCVLLEESFWEVSPAAQNYLQSIADKNQWHTRAEIIEEELRKRPACLQVFANRSFHHHVSVFAATFLDYEGEGYYSGGAERYLVDLHEVCSELGLKLDVYQYGNYSWYRKYNDIDVYSLGHESLDMRIFSLDNLKAFNRRYLYASEEKSMMNFYSAFFQAYPNVAHPSIGISHGVAWDHPGCDFKEAGFFWNFNERFIQSAAKVQKMVSVDTNTPNWFQTISHKIGQKMMTIPNYVDTGEFFPVPKKNEGKVRIVYPRRLYEARGLYITLAVVDNILQKYPETEFHFVGKGFEEDVKRVEEAAERWPGRIFCYHRAPDDMHLVYKEADIVLIPTLYSEGTSLSCLEACATGNTVIATRIGGLTDIIINRFNGLLIDPDSKSLERAIIECLEQPELRKELGKHALEVSKAFNKDIWKERWKTVIREMLAENGHDLDANNDIPSTKAVEFRLGPNANREEWIKEAVEYLKQGMAIFIRGNSPEGMESSFGRLQWISEHTELYFQPIVKKFD